MVFVGLKWEIQLTHVEVYYSLLVSTGTVLYPMIFVSKNHQPIKEFMNPLGLACFFFFSWWYPTLQVLWSLNLRKTFISGYSWLAIQGGIFSCFLSRPQRLECLGISWVTLHHRSAIRGSTVGALVPSVVLTNSEEGLDTPGNWTANAPKNRQSQEETHLPTIIFQGRAVKFLGCIHRIFSCFLDSMFLDVSTGTAFQLRNGKKTWTGCFWMFDFCFLLSDVFPIVSKLNILN